MPTVGIVLLILYFCLLKHLFEHSRVENRKRSAVSHGTGLLKRGCLGAGCSGFSGLGLRCKPLCALNDGKGVHPCNKCLPFLSPQLNDKRSVLSLFNQMRYRFVHSHLPGLQRIKMTLSKEALPAVLFSRIHYFDSHVSWGFSSVYVSVGHCIFLYVPPCALWDSCRL